MKTALILLFSLSLGLISLQGLQDIGLSLNDLKSSHVLMADNNDTNGYQYQSAISTQHMKFKEVLQPSFQVLKKVFVPVVGMLLLIWILLGIATDNKFKNNNNMKNLPIILCLLFFGTGLLAQDKIKITDANQLPSHTYKLEDGNAMNYLTNHELALRLGQKIEANIKADLEKYDIQDYSTLEHYYDFFGMMAYFNKDYKKSLAYYNKSLDYQTKEVGKYMSNLDIRIYLETKIKHPNASEEDFKKEFKKLYTLHINTLPYDVVKEDIEGAIGFMPLFTKNIYENVLISNVQPVIDKSKDNYAQNDAIGLLEGKFGYEIYIPYIKEVYLPVYEAYYTANHEEVIVEEIWSERNVELPPNQTPVVVCVWDGGVDISVFDKKNIWVNTSEKLDGKDNDGNGFIDDINGIGFDLESNPTTPILLPAKDINPEINKYARLSKGLSDVQDNIQSDEAAEFKKILSQLKKEDMQPFLESLNLFGSYAHGTHVAGILLAGNPNAKLLTTRITFNHKIIGPIPTIEGSQRDAEMFTNTIQYFKDNNVKVVNMSWGGSQKGIEKGLAENGVGETAEERKALAAEMYAIQEKAIFNAMKNAPEILFICSAGNSNDDVDFNKNIPSGFDLPNIMKIGAVDAEGKITGFTTTGKSVSVYANGYEVESYIPGGDIHKMSGTSMASPQVANLAAKLWSVSPNLTVQEVKNIIEKTATPSVHDQSILLIHPKNAVKMAKNMDR